jgi:hypothetical protein
MAVLTAFPSLDATLRFFCLPYLPLYSFVCLSTINSTKHMSEFLTTDVLDALLSASHVERQAAEAVLRNWTVDQRIRALLQALTQQPSTNLPQSQAIVVREPVSRTEHHQQLLAVLLRREIQQSSHVALLHDAMEPLLQRIVTHSYSPGVSTNVVGDCVAEIVSVTAALASHDDGVRLVRRILSSVAEPVRTRSSNPRDAMMQCDTHITIHTRILSILPCETTHAYAHTTYINLLTHSQSMSVSLVGIPRRPFLIETLGCRGGTGTDRLCTRRGR